MDDWSQGAPLEKVRALCDYWGDRYDWRRCEAMLNGWSQHRTSLDGLGIHFLHVRSPEPDALPMIMSHGWPGSMTPRQHGGVDAGGVVWERLQVSSADGHRGPW